ncbi:MAG: PKD domain-containing protein [Flavobacteriales bacterium]|nr:PKD domain-containing protein [Flavobacteriales bacterium]
MKYLLPIFSVLFIFASCKKQPTANFTVSDQHPTTNQELFFTNLSTDGLTYTWDFGDGVTSTEENPTHSYTTSGSYIIRLTAYSKKEKKSHTSDMTITVEKSTYEKMIGQWTADSTRFSSYQNETLLSSNVQVLSGAFVTYTTEFKTDGTYENNVDGDISTGTWSVVNNGQSLKADGDIVDILLLDETNFHYLVVEDTVIDSDKFVDSIFVYYSR